MSILKILTDIDKATQKIDKASQAVDKISTMFDTKPALSKKPPTAEEREKWVKARIREKGLQPLFRDIYPDL
jgi:DNA polymerase III delta subunit